MAGLSIDTSSLRLLAYDLGKAGATASVAAVKAITKTAYDIEATAKSLCPVDTGNLRNSISTSAVGLTAEVGPTAEYAAYVEFGTSRMGPQPYMYPAADQHEAELEEALSQIVGHLL